MADLIELFRHIKSKPGLYICPVKYQLAVALITGYDLASDDLLLQGFHEWLMLKLECRSSFYWGRLIPMIAFPNTPDLFQECSKDTPSIEDEKVAITTLFDELEEFYFVKKDRSRGIRWIYAQHDELSKRLDAKHVAGLSPEEIEEGKHAAVIKDGRIYDAYSGPNGMTIEEYKNAWSGIFEIDFGSEPVQPVSSVPENSVSPSNFGENSKDESSGINESLDNPPRKEQQNAPNKTNINRH